MTNPRKIEQAPQRKLIDNLEKVAGDLISYVTDLQKVRELVELLAEVDKVYNGPRKSWFWGWLYVYYRVRSQDINALVATLNQIGSKETLLEAIVQFFSSGGWESTSANTNLMYKLVSRLPGYADVNPQESLTPANMERLKDLFNAQACQLLMPDRFNELKKAERQEELKSLANRDIKQAADLLSTMLPISTKKEERAEKNKSSQLKNKMVPVKRGNKLDMKSFTNVQKTLEAIMARRLNKGSELQQNHLDSQSESEEATMKFDVKKLDRSRIEALQEKLAPALQAQSAMLVRKTETIPSRYVGDDETIILPPPSPPALCEAAYAASDELYTSKQQAYVAPEAKPLKKEKYDAMFKLFPQAAAPKSEKDPAPETAQAEGFEIPPAPANYMK